MSKLAFKRFNQYNIDISKRNFSIGEIITASDGTECKVCESLYIDSSSKDLPGSEHKLCAIFNPDKTAGICNLIGCHFSTGKLENCNANCGRLCFINIKGISG